MRATCKPAGVAQIETIRPLIAKLIAESEILSEEKPPIGGILSERASRPLLSEKDEKVKEMVMGKIIKKAEEKIVEGGKPRVTEKE